MLAAAGICELLMVWSLFPRVAEYMERSARHAKEANDLAKRSGGDGRLVSPLG